MAMIVPDGAGRLATVAAFGRGLGEVMAKTIGARPPPVTVQVPSQGLNAVQMAALMTMAEQAGEKVAELIGIVAPYAKFGFYTFMVLLALHVVEKGTRIFGPPIVAAARAVLVVAKVGVYMTGATAKVFLKVSAKLISALYKEGQTKARQVLAIIGRIQTAIGHSIRTVKAGLAAMASVARRTSTAVMGALGRSAKRLRTVGARLKSAHVSYKKRRAVKAEETRVKGLISKVRKSNAPLTLKEKQEYLKMAHKANSVAAQAAKAARNERMLNAAKTLRSLKRKRSH